MAWLGYVWVGVQVRICCTVWEYFGERNRDREGIDKDINRCRDALVPAQPLGNQTFV